MKKRSRSRRRSFQWQDAPENPTISYATMTASTRFDDDDETLRWEDPTTFAEGGLDAAEACYVDDGLDDDDETLSLHDLGMVDPETVLEAIADISDRYLSDVEGDLIWLMRQGRRPVEISRILKVPECEIVRLRKNCFRKIRTVYRYDYMHDKAAFLENAVRDLGLNTKQARIFQMFFQYHGLRQIAETISTRPSNVHRSLEMMRRRLAGLYPAGHEYHFFIGAFRDFKYLCLTVRAEPRGTREPSP